MAIERKLGLIIVTAALFAVTIGCKSTPPGPPPGPEGAGVNAPAAVNEAGTAKKIPPKFSPAAKDAIRSMKGGGDP